MPVSTDAIVCEGLVVPSGPTYWKTGSAYSKRRSGPGGGVLRDGRLEIGASVADVKGIYPVIVGSTHGIQALRWRSRGRCSSNKVAKARPLVNDWHSTRLSGWVGRLGGRTNHSSPKVAKSSSALCIPCLRE